MLQRLDQRPHHNQMAQSAPPSPHRTFAIAHPGRAVVCASAYLVCLPMAFPSA